MRYLGEMTTNLILLSGNFPPETGGPAKFVGDFSKWASNHFDRVVVISTHQSGDLIFSEEKVKVHLLSRKGSRLIRYLKTAQVIAKNCDRDSKILANGSLIELFFAFFLKKMNVVVKLPGDIVWEQARAQGLTMLGMSDFQKSRLVGKLWLLRKITLASLKRARLIIVPSRALYEVCINWGLAPGKLTYIPNGIDTELFRPIESDFKDFDVITVARLIEIKKIDELISVCSNLKLRLMVVGDGPELEKLQALNSQMAGTTEFFGRANQLALPNLYNKSRIFVLNSIFEAGTPYAILEARACGLPSIARENTGADDIINHGFDGYLWGDSHNLSLAEALELALSKEELGEIDKDTIVRDSESRFSKESIYPKILRVLLDDCA